MELEWTQAASTFPLYTSLQNDVEAQVKRFDLVVVTTRRWLLLSGIV